MSQAADLAGDGPPTLLLSILQQLVEGQQRQEETQRKTSEVLAQLQQAQGQRQAAPQIASGGIPADEAKHHQMPKFSGYPRNFTASKSNMYELMDTLFQFIQEAELWMDNRPTNPGRTTQRLVCMLKDEAGTWYLGQVRVPDQPDPEYNSLKQKLIARYVHSEVKMQLRYELQGYMWSKGVSMRQHCEKFHMMANRLAVFGELTMDERWRWFKDSMRTCEAARQYMVTADWWDVTSVTAEELSACSNKVCAIVDGGYSGGYNAAPAAAAASAGPTPMDIDQLAVQLRAQPEACDMLLAALGVEDRRQSRGRSFQPGGGGWQGRASDRDWRGQSGGGWRNRSPERSGGWRGRGGGGGWQGGGGRSPSPPPSISALKRHRLWPRWAMAWTQDRIDRATREGQCFFCNDERHEGGWPRCPNLNRSRTPTPVRERWGSPNGGGAPQQGR